MSQDDASAPALDPSLVRDLDSGAAGPFLILVAFRAAPPERELRSLGLQMGEAGQALGSLTAAAVRALAARPDVAAIVRLQEAAAPPASPDLAKLDPLLVTRLEEQPGGIHPVVVRFRQPPTREVLDSLGLGGGGSPIATGRLDRQGILRLAEREDVVRVEPMPEYLPSA